ncbi:hypothetical protein CsSME_00050109 [Camellia sinensis var. sinensis]
MVGFGDILPIHNVEFRFFRRRSPQDVSVKLVNGLDGFLRKEVGLHDIGGNGSINRFYEGSSAYRRKKFGSPTSEFVLDLLNDEIEGIGIWFIMMDGPTQVFAKVQGMGDLELVSKHGAGLVIHIV